MVIKNTPNNKIYLFKEVGLTEIVKLSWKMKYTYIICICQIMPHSMSTYIWIKHPSSKLSVNCSSNHDDVIKWKHLPRYWPFVRGIHRSPVNSPHKGQWRGALIFSLICVWINGWENNREAGDLRRYRPHYDVTIMVYDFPCARPYLPQRWTRRWAVLFCNTAKGREVANEPLTAD